MKLARRPESTSCARIDGQPFKPLLAGDLVKLLVLYNFLAQREQRTLRDSPDGRQRAHHLLNEEGNIEAGQVILTTLAS